MLLRMRLPCFASGMMLMMLVLTVGGSGCGRPQANPCAFGPAQVVALDEPLPEGGTPGEILARAQGIRRGWFEWLDRGADFQVTPPAARTTFEIDVSGTSATARYFPGLNPQKQQAPLCPGRLEIDGAIRFVTADGGLAEDWMIPLEWSPPATEMRVLVDLRTHLPVGTFSATYTGPEPIDTSSLRFSANINKQNASGGIEFSASATRGTLGTGFGTGLATWMSSP